MQLQDSQHGQSRDVHSLTLLGIATAGTASCAAKEKLPQHSSARKRRRLSVVLLLGRVFAVLLTVRFG